MKQRLRHPLGVQEENVDDELFYFTDTQDTAFEQSAYWQDSDEDWLLGNEGDDDLEDADDYETTDDYVLEQYVSEQSDTEANSDRFERISESALEAAEAMPSTSAQLPARKVKPQQTDLHHAERPKPFASKDLPNVPPVIASNSYAGAYWEAIREEYSLLTYLAKGAASSSLTAEIDRQIAAMIPIALHLAPYAYRQLWPALSPLSQCCRETLHSLPTRAQQKHLLLLLPNILKGTIDQLAPIALQNQLSLSGVKRCFQKQFKQILAASYGKASAFNS